MDKLKYSISMQNFFRPLSKKSEAYATAIKTDYLRDTHCVNNEKIYFYDFEVEHTLFTSTQLSEEMEWTFAKGLKFSMIANYESGEKRKALFEFKDTPQMQTVVENLSLDKTFAHLPKLPSTYLMLMQVIDILTIETYASFFHSSNIRNQKPSFIYKRADEFSGETFHIGFNQLAEGSSFVNGELFFRYLGEVEVDSNKRCDLYDYYADESSVKTAFMNQVNFSESKSLFSGKLLMDIENQCIYYGDLIENVVPFNAKNGIFKRRIIEMIRLE